MRTRPHPRPTPPLRVLITADTVGGVWDYSLTLCHGLITAHGATVDLVSMGPLPSAEQCAAAARISNLTLIPTRYALEWMPDSLPDLQQAGRFLQGLVADRQPRIVHFNQHCFGSLELPVPSVVVSHSDSLSWQQAHWGQVSTDSGWQAYRDLLRDGLRGATAVVVPTRFVADCLHAHYLPDLPVQVIPNGAALDDPAPSLPGEPRPIDALGAGRVWDSAKNLLLLAQAAALPHSFQRVEIAGSLQAPHGDHLETGQYSGVRFLGRLPRAQLHARLGQTRVFVAPARYEPFGLTLVEAALAGCALLIADIPSLREVWGDTATYASNTDPAALGAALSALLGDDGRRIECAEAARARAHQRYGVATMTDAYMALYGQLLDQPARVGRL